MEENRIFTVQGETLIIRLPEELDHHTAGEIKEGTEDLFVSRKIRDVIFDYTNTYFMDSSGIGLVMGRYREVRYLKGDIYITGVNYKIARILEISGLYRVVQREKSIADALEQIAAKYAKINCG